MNMSIVLTIVLAVQMLSAIVMIGLCWYSTVKALIWVQLLEAAARAASLARAVVPTFCRVQRVFWQRYFLPALCCWRILETPSRAAQVQAYWTAPRWLLQLQSMLLRPLVPLRKFRE